MRFLAVTAINLLIASLALGAPLEQNIRQCDPVTGECKTLTGGTAPHPTPAPTATAVVAARDDGDVSISFGSQPTATDVIHTPEEEIELSTRDVDEDEHEAGGGDGTITFGSQPTATTVIRTPEEESKLSTREEANETGEDDENTIQARTDKKEAKEKKKEDKKKDKEEKKEDKKGGGDNDDDNKPTTTTTQAPKTTQTKSTPTPSKAKVCKNKRMH